MVGALSVMVHRSESQRLGRETVEKLKEVIPRQNFQVAIQAGINGRFIAREDLSAYRKDVTTGLYGGDVSRKKKVLAKQAKGKKRMKRLAKSTSPPKPSPSCSNATKPYRRRSTFCPKGKRYLLNMHPRLN